MAKTVTTRLEEKYVTKIDEMAAKKGIDRSALLRLFLVNSLRGQTIQDSLESYRSGTITVILQAVKNRMMDFDEFLSTLESIIYSGFYLKDEVYIKVIRKARQLSEEQL